MDKTWLLQKLDLFKLLPHSVVEEIDSHSLMESYKKGDSLYVGLSDVDYIYILKNGYIKITFSNYEGKELIVEILKPGEIFGVLDMAQKEDSYRSILSDAENIESAVAISDITICRVPQKEFAYIAKNCPELNLKIIKIVGLRFKKITSKIANLLYKDLDSRIAWALIELYEKFGKNDPVNTRLIGIKLTTKRLQLL